MRRCALCRADTDGARPIRGAASEPAPLRGPCGPREPASRTCRRALPWLRPDREGGARPARPSQGDGRPVEVAPRSAAPGKASDRQGRGALAIAECPTHDPALRRRREAHTAEQTACILASRWPNEADLPPTGDSTGAKRVHIPRVARRGVVVSVRRVAKFMPVVVALALVSSVGAT